MTNEPETTIQDVTYIVQQGDTLQSITLQVYGDCSEAHCQAIYQINQVIFDAGLSIGDVLLLLEVSGSNDSPDGVIAHDS